MLDAAALKRAAHAKGLTQTARLLMCLAVGDAAKSPATLRLIGKSAGISGMQNWNISQLLSGAKGRAISTDQGWELTEAGRDFVGQLVGPLDAGPPPKPAANLRAHLATIKTPETRDFIEQAIECYERHLYRAAVVLSWVGAVALLQEHVLKHVLVAFNAEAQHRNPKWKDAKTADDLSLMRESDFLHVLQAISVIGKSVKEELESRLKLRNGCGHPNSLKVAEHAVAYHLESLTLNVFAKF